MSSSKRKRGKTIMDILRSESSNLPQSQPPPPLSQAPLQVPTRSRAHVQPPSQSQLPPQPLTRSRAHFQPLLQSQLPPQQSQASSQAPTRSRAHVQPPSQSQLPPQAPTRSRAHVQPPLQSELPPQIQSQPRASSQLSQVEESQSTELTELPPQIQSQPRVSSQPSQVEESQSTQPTGPSVSGSTSTKHGRGIAKGLDTWGTGEKLELEFNQYFQPIGDNSSHLATHLGIIARSGERVPLHYAQWPDIPNDILDNIWKEVQDNTDAPPEFRPNCLKAVAYLWRRWKCFVKTNFYNIWDTDEERLAHPPSRVVREQWETLIEYWGTEKQKVISAKNKENRESQELHHRTGRTPFAVVRSKMGAKGEKTDRISTFKKTRTPSGEAPIHPQTAIVIAEMENRRDAVPEEEQTPEFLDNIFIEVLGPDGHGCVRTYGSGPTPTSIFGKGMMASTSQSMENKIREKVREEIMSEVGAMMVAMEKKIREDVRAEILADIEKERHTQGGNGPTTPTRVPTSSSVHCNDIDAEGDQSFYDEDMGEEECFKI